MSCRRPSNASSSMTGPRGPVTVRPGSTSTIGSRRRAAAIASPSLVCAFSLTRSRSSSAWKVARSTAAGRPGAVVAADLLVLSVFSVMVLSFLAVSRLPVFRVRGFGEALDRGKPPVPLGGELSHGPGRLVEAAGLHLVENLPALLAPADEPGPFEHDQVLGDGLAGKRHPPGQPAGAY